MQQPARIAVRSTVLAALAAALSPAAALADRKPETLTPPAISGVPAVGETLTADIGAWKHPSHLALLAHWRRCDASGEECVRVRGQGLSYLLGDADAYHTIRVKVYARNGHDRTTRLLSAPTEVVLTPHASGPTLLSESFDGPDRLVTNDYAYRFPGAADAVVSPDWTMPNGSLFARGGVGWTGVPDNGVTDATSSSATHSASFRLVSRRADIGDAMLSLRLNPLGFTSTSSTPAVNWDGVNAVLRWQSLYSFYAIAAERRDGQVVIKKKVAGGASYGGTYTTLAARPAPAPQPWDSVKAVAHTNDDGSVTLGLFRNDRLLVSVTDRGAGGAPPLGAGHAGLYGDNQELELDDLAVTGL